MSNPVTLYGIEGLPEVRAGDDLPGLLLDAAGRQGVALEDGDVLVVTQKVVSKAEGRIVDLRGVTPSALAVEFAAQWEKDARAVEVALREAVRVVRMDRGVLITETRHGFVCANSGVDASNVGTGSQDHVVLLPEDPDASAGRIRDAVRERSGAAIAVIISDTFGRAWREGAGNVAIGCAGIGTVGLPGSARQRRPRAAVDDDSGGGRDSGGGGARDEQAHARPRGHRSRVPVRPERGGRRPAHPHAR